MAIVIINGLQMYFLSQLLMQMEMHFIFYNSSFGYLTIMIIRDSPTDQPTDEARFPGLCISYKNLPSVSTDYYKALLVCWTMYKL